MISNIINFGNITSPRTISKPYKQAFISNQHLEAVMHPVFTKTILLYSVVQQELHTKETTLLFITSRKAIGFVIGRTFKLLVYFLLPFSNTFPSPIYNLQEPINQRGSNECLFLGWLRVINLVLTHTLSSRFTPPNATYYLPSHT